jgi:hypothetical protein
MTFLLAFALLAFLPATAAAASLAIVPPASPPAEDSGFPIVASGTADGFADGDAELTAKIRPAGAPCAPRPEDDSGDRIDGLNRVLVAGTFSLTGSQVLRTAGNYVICAWLEEECCAPVARVGPVSVTMAVRVPQLTIGMRAPASVTVGQPFEVTVDYFAEVPRYLSVVVARASSCSISGSALKGISTNYQNVSNEQELSGSGTIRGAVRFDEPGTYLVCGFFETTSSGAAQYAAAGPRVVVKARARTRSCGSAGGRRHITNVRAKVTSCSAAKTLARRWGTRPKRRVGSFSCSTRGRVVTCTAGAGQRVTFLFRRSG